MKSCNEMVDSLLERRGQYEAERKRRRKMLTCTLGCVCLLAILAVGGWQGGVFENQPIQTLNDAIVPGIKDWYGPGEEEPSVSQSESDSVSQEQASVEEDYSTKYLFGINEISATADATSLYRDPDLHYREVWTLEQTAEYLGIDAIQAVAALPGDLQYVNDHEFTVLFENNGTLVEDVMGYHFSGSNGESLSILASKLRDPYDCLYVSNTDKITNIRLPEKDVVIPLRVYARDKSDTALEYEFYVIDFEYAGIHYRITAENLSSYWLDALIRELVK